MRHERDFPAISAEELEKIGTGVVAYLRQMTGAQLREAFPAIDLSAIEAVEPDASVWALIGADGEPLMIAGEASQAMAAAFQNQLIPVAVH
jgi:hypothetical protein